jgi:hypothetical protein
MPRTRAHHDTTLAITQKISWSQLVDPERRGFGFDQWLQQPTGICETNADAAADACTFTRDARS